MPGGPTTSRPAWSDDIVAVEPFPHDVRRRGPVTVAGEQGRKAVRVGAGQVQHGDSSPRLRSRTSPACPVLAAHGQVAALAVTEDEQLRAVRAGPHGRAAIFRHYLQGLKLAARLDPERLAADLVSSAAGLTGANIAYVCRRAAMVCVKEAAGASLDREDIAIAEHHFHAALAQVTGQHQAGKTPEGPRLVVAC